MDDAGRRRRGLDVEALPSPPCPSHSRSPGRARSADDHVQVVDQVGARGTAGPCDAATIRRRGRRPALGRASAVHRRRRRRSWKVVPPPSRGSVAVGASDHDRGVEDRVVTPLRPCRLRGPPRPALGAELVATHDLGADPRPPLARERLVRPNEPSVSPWIRIARNVRVSKAALHQPVTGVADGARASGPRPYRSRRGRSRSCGRARRGMRSP